MKIIMLCKARIFWEGHEKLKTFPQFSFTTFANFSGKNEDEHLIKIANMVNSFKASMLKPTEFQSKYVNPAQPWYLIRYWMIGKRLFENSPHFDLLIITDFYSINGILLSKLFWPTVRKKCYSDREKLLKFKVEGQKFSWIK